VRVEEIDDPRECVGGLRVDAVGLGRPDGPRIARQRRQDLALAVAGVALGIAGDTQAERDQRLDGLAGFLLETANPIEVRTTASPPRSQ
jgi:hypothetical protein